VPENDVEVCEVRSGNFSYFWVSFGPRHKRNPKVWKVATSHLPLATT